MSKEKRNKFSIDKKVRVVLSIVNGSESYRSAARALKTSHRLVSLWVDCYARYGRKGLSFKASSCFSGEFKLSAMKEMEEHGLSLHEMSLLHRISPSVLHAWKRRYEQHGASSFLEAMKRGRPPKMQKKKSKRSCEPKSMEELLHENERLRAENDYLKKLQALTQKKGAHHKSSEPKSSKS